jgi:carbon-monoxide dehydrogenase large subunit
MPERQIGRSLTRFEDARFLRGAGRFVENIAVENALHGWVVRSPHGHAEILGIDIAAARALPGVHGVFSAADLAADKIGPLPCVAQVATVEPMIVPPRHALAAGRVRHVGDPVAFVVAETREVARDAAELVAVDYRVLSAVVDAAAALREGAPQLWDEAPGNLCFRFERGDRAAVEAAMAGPSASSRSSWSTTGWSWRRSSPAPGSAAMI